MCKMTCYYEKMANLRGRGYALYILEKHDYLLMGKI